MNVSDLIHVEGQHLRQQLLVVKGKEIVETERVIDRAYWLATAIVRKEAESLGQGPFWAQGMKNVVRYCGMMLCRVLPIVWSVLSICSLASDRKFRSDTGLSTGDFGTPNHLAHSQPN